MENRFLQKMSLCLIVISLLSGLYSAGVYASTEAPSKPIPLNGDWKKGARSIVGVTSVSAFINGTKSPTGNELLIQFKAKPDDLFQIYPEKSYREDKEHFVIKSIKNLKYNLSLPLFEWDLENYSSIIKIAIEEVDNQETITNTSTTSSEFAANFGFDIGFGEKVKIGAKFGASLKDTRTQTFTVTTAHGNDILGEVLINFGDPIILSKNDMGGYRTPNEIDPEYNNKYENGWYRLQISPKRAY